MTRKTRITSVVCDRPTFILRLLESDLVPTRTEYTLTPFLSMRVAVNAPSASVDREIYQVEAQPKTCST